MPFRRPVTIMRMLYHALYWSIGYAVTLSQFKRALADYPETDLLYLVNTHHFLSTLLSFGLLGYIVIPYILYHERTMKKRVAMLMGACVIYYALLSVNTYVLLKYVEAHFSNLPPYLARRVTMFSVTHWYDYVIDPSIAFFIYGHFISYLTIPLLIKAVRDGYARSRLQQQAEKERRQLEYDKLALEKEGIVKDLHFLRQQINPHFLLNAFNNIYTMIHRKDGRAADTLANLSTLMRYTLYRTGNDFVPLSDELTFINGYIDMERIRHSRTDAVSCQLPYASTELKQWQVPPLLLVTFIENAFKHGLNAVYEGGWVRISLSTNPSEGRLTLSVVNNRPETPPAPKEGGLGLANARRRLALLFSPQEYELIIKDQPDQFVVWLSIPLRHVGETIETTKRTYEHAHPMLTH
jgi:two-component system, LytTR family, sensor kinase